MKEIINNFKDLINWRIPGGIYGIHPLRQQLKFLKRLLKILESLQPEEIPVFESSLEIQEDLLVELVDNSLELDEDIPVEVNELHPLVDSTIQQILLLLDDTLSDTDRQEIDASLLIRDRCIKINNQLVHKSVFRRVLLELRMKDKFIDTNIHIHQSVHQSIFRGVLLSLIHQSAFRILDDEDEDLYS